MSSPNSIPVGESDGSGAELEGAYRKITLKLIPFLAGLWILAWIDRVNIGFVKLTMLEDLEWSEAVYGLGAGVFFLGYFFFEVPSNLLLQKIGAKKTIMRIMIGWGLTSVAMMFVTTPAMFYFLRFLLGVFEAGFYPGIILFLTYWFPHSRRSKAFGMFMSASAFAGVLGGPLAGWIMTSLDGVSGMHGWQWVFVVEGAPSVIAGLVTWFYLCDRPEAAKWLTPRQKEIVLADIAREDAALGDRQHNMLATLKQARIWQFIAIYFCIVVANSAQTFFGPTIIKEVGFDSPVAIGWIMALAYLLGAAGMIYNGFHSDKHLESRWHSGLAAALGSVSFAVIAVTIDVSPVITLVALVLAIVGTMSAIPVFWQMPNQFLAGAAAAGGIALINSMANLAGFGTPYMLGAVETSTGSYSPGLFVVAAFEIVATVLILVCIPRFKKDKHTASEPAKQEVEAPLA